MKLKKVTSVVLFLFLILNLVSCAPAGVTEHEYGFSGGLWHGIISPISAIGFIFISDIGYMAETNNGFFYYSGWVLGIIISIPVGLLFKYAIVLIFMGITASFEFLKETLKGGLILNKRNKN